MNGPSPVCTSARKKINQSSPRRLWREGVGLSSSTGGVAIGGTTLSPIESPRRFPSVRSGEWDGRTTRRFPPLMIVQRLQIAGRAQYHDRLVLLVFGRCGDLGLGQFERDAIALVGDTPEMQRVPVDYDFSATDA